MTSAVRLASLVPSLTELAVAVGLAPVLVARTGFCIHPAAALADVPKVGGTKDVNLARLQRLAPTHLLVNPDENRRETVEAIRAWPVAPEIVVLHPLTPDDNIGLVEQLTLRFGAEPGVAERGARLRADLLHELALTRPADRPVRRVLYLIWRDPWMTVARDTYISAMLARVGWHTWPEAEGGPTGAARYPALAGDEAWLADVDLVLLSSEPYRFDAGHLAEAGRLCPRARPMLVDGEMLSWYGSRAVPGLQYLRDVAAAVDGRATIADK